MAVTNQLRVDRINSQADLQALEPEWRTLFAITEVLLPFMTFEWVDSWWKNLRRDHWTVRDSLQLRTVRTQAGELVAVAPFMLTERPAVGPLRVRVLNFIGADPNITELRGMLVHPQYEPEAYSAVMGDLATSPWDWVQWSGLRQGTTENPVLPRLSSAPRQTPALLLPLAASWEEFRAGLRKRTLRKSLTHCYRSLERDGHTYELRVSQSAEEVAPAIDRFLALHRARAEWSDTSVPHPNVFKTPEAVCFLHQVCERLTASGASRVFELAINGAVVASRIGFQFRDTLYLYYSGYDPAWSAYSVMTTTLAEAIKYAIGEGLRTVNLSTGIDQAKMRWEPEVVNYDEGIQMAAGLRSRLAYSLYERRSSFSLTNQTRWGDRPEQGDSQTAPGPPEFARTKVGVSEC